MFFKKENPNLLKTNGQKRIYLDHAAATPVRKEVLGAMQPYWNENFGNPGSIHKEGVIAKKAVYESRKKISELLNSSEDEIIFTSCGTESNSLAVFGFIDKLTEKNNDIKNLHLITTVMEHPSILDLFKKYEKKGAQVDYLKIDKEGIVDLKHFREILKPNTALVSVMYANNEIGTVQPISKLSHIIRNNNKNLSSGDLNTVFHVDASQAPLYLNLDVKSLGVDMLTIDGQKIYGPKGIGVLYKKRGIEINPLLVGGSQEMGYRAGTENVPSIVGLAKALELA
ncbi:cysteine desulfurase, partial [Patescibacteria group bacterium]|nr:cysteine desulfurase [Patescibacteria group bacterium]